MYSENLKYQIAINLIPKIGNVMAKNLIAYIGSVEGVFKESKKNLSKIEGIGKVLANNIYSASKLLEMAEEEIEFLIRNDIKPFFYLDKNYPKRLKRCVDCPILFYSKGNINLDADKIISFVGTRKATQYGKYICNQIIKDLGENYPNAIIVSGLAYGIDITAHKSALENGLNTIAVLGSGFKKLYPSIHKSTAKKIITQGALISEYLSTTEPDKFNFVQRNRIIAGISDATVVVESGEKGGALITADLADSYHREVFAIPNKIGKDYPNGCNQLIKKNKAILLESADDLEYFLGWEKNQMKEKRHIQKQLIYPLTKEEKIVLNVLKSNKNLDVDTLSDKANLPVNKIALSLFNLELHKTVRMLPGNKYSAVI